jgi:hypothetical protein
MPISGPKGAVPTIRGWMDPRTNEILSVRKFTQAQIDEWYGVDTTPPEPVVTTLFEAPTNNKSMDEMTKFELEALGRQHGIELDRRQTKESLITELEEAGIS